MVTDENGTSIWDPFYPKDKLFEAKQLVEETKAQKVKGYDAYQRERERVLSQLDAETNKTMNVSLFPYLRVQALKFGLCSYLKGRRCSSTVRICG
jgi:hypothetical protein